MYQVVENEPENLVYKDYSNKKIESPDHWRLNSVKRIAHQRNQLFEAVSKITDDEDYIMYSDNDEIPNLALFDLKKEQN